MCTYGLRLSASIFDIKYKRKILNVFVYILYSTPIPFLLEIKDQLRLCFNIFLGEKHYSHLRLTMLPLMVTSNQWLRFEPRNQCSPTTPYWKSIISRSKFGPEICLITSNSQARTFLIGSQSHLPKEDRSRLLIPPYTCDTWTRHITKMELFRLHHPLKNLETTSFRNVIWQGLG